MTSVSRRALLAGCAALGALPLLPTAARAERDTQPWTGGRLWIVGTGRLGLHLRDAFAHIENVQVRLAASLAGCRIQRDDVVLLGVSAPPAPLSEAGFAAELDAIVAGLRSRGAAPMLLGMHAPAAWAETWPAILAAHAARLAAPLVDLNTFGMSVDAGQTSGGGAALAGGVVRRVGLYLPLREEGVACSRTPLSLESAACRRTMRAVAYVPDSALQAPRPVLYLLHGAWGAWSDWSLAAHDGLCRAAIEHDLILVCPDGLPFGWYLDATQVPESQVRTHIMEEVLPLVERVLPTDGRKSIGGLSMGGHGALLLSLTHPGTFRSASSMSGAVDICHVPKSKQITRLLGPYKDNQAAWIAHSAARQLIARVEDARQLPMRLTCGTRDIWFQTNREVHQGLVRRDVDHVWEATPGAGHTWDYWIDQLPKHVAWHAPYLHAAASPESP